MQAKEVISTIISDEWEIQEAAALLILLLSLWLLGFVNYPQLGGTQQCKMELDWCSKHGTQYSTQ